MSTEHTPRRWSVANGIYPSFKKVVGPSFSISAVMFATDLTEDDYRKRNADLHLIAAAPDLLEAMKAASNYIDALGGDSKGYRQAIAKAEGGEA